MAKDGGFSRGGLTVFVVHDDFSRFDLSASYLLPPPRPLHFTVSSRHNLIKSLFLLHLVALHCIASFGPPFSIRMSFFFRSGPSLVFIRLSQRDSRAGFFFERDFPDS